MVLPHEHILLDYRTAYVKPSFTHDSGHVFNLDFKMENLGIIRQFPLVICVNGVRTSTVLA